MQKLHGSSRLCPLKPNPEDTEAAEAQVPLTGAAYAGAAGPTSPQAAGYAGAGYAGAAGPTSPQSAGYAGAGYAGAAYPTGQQAGGFVTSKFAFRGLGACGLGLRG